MLRAFVLSSLRPGGLLYFLGDVMNIRDAYKRKEVDDENCSSI
jgi:hypothetical protein